jgi:hypothetical protein
MHWWLYLYLGGAGVVSVPGHFDDLAECRAAGAKAVIDFRSIHTRSPCYAWCIQGGKDDL